MAERWNLTTTDWSNVLLKGATPKGVAEALRMGSVLPWSKTLQQLTAGSTSTLDLGSGRGDHSAVLAMSGKATTLLDWSKENISFSEQIFKEMSLKGKFYQADITKPLPFEDDSFDTVFSCGVLEYFTNETIQSIIREAFRVASKRVIIMVPNSSSLAYRIGKWYMERKGIWEWGGEIPFYTLKPYFQNAGGRQIVEFTVSGKTALNFLSPMPMGKRLAGICTRVLKLEDCPGRSRWRQGYLLVTVGEKVPERM